MSGSGKEFDWLTELDGAAREEVDDWQALSSAERAEIERLDAEVFGLLPYALDPVEPGPEVKQALMRRLETPPVAAFPDRGPRPVPPRWLMPLAAGLTALAIGLAATMLGTVREQRAQIAQLESRIEQLAGDSIARAELEEGLAAAQENLQLVSSRGVEICALRPTTAAASGKGPHGLLFLAADHQHWYVKVTGLETEADRYYRLWFETEDGLVPAGNLTAQGLELGAATMPEGTRAVHVSVETAPNPSTPSDEIVLYGDDMVQVL